MPGKEDMYKPLTTVRDFMWEPLTTVRDSMWIGLGEALVRYARLVLETVSKLYRGETDPATFRMKVKDKIYHMITRTSRRY